jgi:hypothetical protein
MICIGESDYFRYNNPDEEFYQIDDDVDVDVDQVERTRPVKEPHSSFLENSPDEKDLYGKMRIKNFNKKLK